MSTRRKFIPHKMPINDPDHEPPPEREICDGESKTIFKTEDEARQEAERLYEKRGAELDVYQCVHCFGWHFTSIDGTGKRKRGKRRK